MLANPLLEPFLLLGLQAFCHLIYAARPTIDAFSNICFSHTRRQGNSIACNLVRHARHVSCYLVWMEDVPPYLQNILQANYG